MLTTGPQDIHRSYLALADQALYLVLCFVVNNYMLRLDVRNTYLDFVAKRAFSGLKTAFFVEPDTTRCSGGAKGEKKRDQDQIQRRQRPKNAIDQISGRLLAPANHV